jgi:hypothetical protein
MRIETTPGPTAPNVLRRPPLVPETKEPDISRCELTAKSSDLPAEHEADLLVASLEQLEVHRVAIKWLLDADLLSLCLV